MTAEDDAKKRASELLFRLAEVRREAISEPSVSEAFSDELIARVLDLAWENQWKREPDAFLRAVRPLVLDASQRGAGDGED